MKKVKALKDGIAILLAILIIIYVASLFFKFKPDELKIEKGISKIYQFFNGTQSNRDYARLAIFMFISGLCGIVFSKQPSLTVFTSALVFAYTITMYSNKQLTKRPMVIIILCLMHLFGNIMYCAMFERNDGKSYSSFAAFSCFGGAFAASLVTLIYQQKLYIVKDMSDALSHATIVTNNKIDFFPDLVTLVYNRYITAGADEARSLISDFNFEIDIPAFKNYFLNNIKLDQMKEYIILSILILVCAVLSIIFAKRFSFIPFAASCFTFSWIFFGMLSDKFSSLTLALVSLSLCALSCSFINMTRKDPVEEDPNEADEDETDVDSASNEETEEDESDFA